MAAVELDQQLSAFFGNDPDAGDTALQDLVASYSASSIELVVPTAADSRVATPQVEIRLAKLAAALGEAAEDHLFGVMRDGEGAARAVATAAFAGLPRGSRVRARLWDLLGSGDVDRQRHVIEALGFYGDRVSAFDLVDVARTGRSSDLSNSRTDTYAFGKLVYYAAQALVRMTRGLRDKEEIASCLRAQQRLWEISNEALGSDPVPMWDLRRVARNFSACAADPIVETWIHGDTPTLASFGIEVLGNFRLNRTAALLVGLMEDHASGAVDPSDAAISLSQYASLVAAEPLAEKVAAGLRSPGIGWAFSALYSQQANWKACDDLVADCLHGSNGEIAAQMAYSMAVRGEGDTERVMEGLDSRASFTRGANAIALAKYMGTGAAPILRSRADEAAEPLERALFLTAQINAGEHRSIDALHETLRDISQLEFLRPIWKREVLNAFFVAEGEQSRRGVLWCEVAAESAKRVQEESATLCGRAPAPSAVQIPAGPIRQATLGKTPPGGPTYDVFISHASEDKDKVARPLYEGLSRAGLSVWFDAATLVLGDVLSRKIDDGLSRCRYGIVILSPSFLSKEWPQRELSGLVARETASGIKAILPIWHEIDRDTLIAASPTLADRLACRSSIGIEAMVQQILSVVRA